jgi:hypothetical protein
MLQKKLRKLKMMTNRNLSSFAKASHLMQKESTQGRKLRTRTLIQAGGLLSLSGLLEQCDIFEGEDLQSDPEGYEKGAALLGILIEASETLLNNNDADQMEKFRQLGIRRMKQAAAKYY